MHHVSVVVPVYNCENYLERAVESLLNQTTPVEIVLVDDGSQDGSPQICDAYHERHESIKVIHTENGGAARAREIGIAAATGEYIGFMDSDDWVKRDMFEVLYEEAKRLDLDMIQCGFVNTDHYELQDSCFDSANTKMFDSMTALKNLYGVDNNRGEFNYLLWNKITRSEIMKIIPMPIKQKSQNDVPVVPKIIWNCSNVGCNNEPLVYYYHRNDTNNESITDKLWKSNGDAIYSHITAFQDVSDYFKLKDRLAYQLSLTHTLAWCLSSLKNTNSSEECKHLAKNIIKSVELSDCKFLPTKKRIAIAVLKTTLGR